MDFSFFYKGLEDFNKYGNAERLDKLSLELSKYGPASYDLLFNFFSTDNTWKYCFVWLIQAIDFSNEQKKTLYNLVLNDQSESVREAAICYAIYEGFKIGIH